MSPPPSTSSSLAELALADRARGGDQQALVELYQRHRDSLFRHAYRMLRQEAAAQDVVQEAFTRAIASMPRTREQLYFKAWVFRIATNLCLRELTQRQRLLDGAPSGDLDDLQAPEDPSSPLEVHRRGEIRTLVERALSRIPDRYRQILVLREVDELSYEELSQVLELGEANVKVTLHRARARLAAEFIAEQLLSDGHVSVDCEGLREILARAERRSRLVQHLESCDHCRHQDTRPAAELFALLPPIPAAAPADLATVGRGSGAPASGPPASARSVCGTSGLSVQSALGPTTAGSGTSIGAVWIAVAVAVAAAAVVSAVAAGSMWAASRVPGPAAPTAPAFLEEATASRARQQAAGASGQVRSSVQPAAPREPAPKSLPLPAALPSTAAPSEQINRAARAPTSRRAPSPRETEAAPRHVDQTLDPESPPGAN
jgi:RNA polymerase sigma-70 factor (ECF subfamily)